MTVRAMVVVGLVLSAVLVAIICGSDGRVGGRFFDVVRPGEVGVAVPSGGVVGPGYGVGSGLLGP